MELSVGLLFNLFDHVNFKKAKNKKQFQNFLIAKADAIKALLGTDLKMPSAGTIDQKYMLIMSQIPDEKKKDFLNLSDEYEQDLIREKERKKELQKKEQEAQRKRDEETRRFIEQKRKDEEEKRRKAMEAEEEKRRREREAEEERKR